MKLTRLRLTHFKQFGQPLEVNDLQAGINLFVGPNESGKSTLAEAIRAAFFERHKSSSVSALQPWGDSGAAPEVALDFDWQGRQWRLEKRFLKSARCDLTIDSERFNGDQADDRLAELLGYRFASRGASKPEHHGIPGLLWVEQGSAQNIDSPVQAAGEYLQSALGASLGDIASSGGDALIARVEGERAELLTRTGKPTGDYKALIADCEQDAEQLAALQAQITTYREQVDRLGTLRQQQHDIDAARPWQAQHDKAQQAQAALDQANTLQTQQQQARQTLEDRARREQLYRQQLQDMAGEQEQLAERGQKRAEADQYVEQCRASRPQIGQQLKDAQAAYQQAADRLKQTRQQADRARLAEEQQRLAKQQSQQTRTLEQARELQEQIRGQRQQLQQTAIDADQLQALKNSEVELAQVSARQKAVATRLTYNLEAGQSLDIGGQAVTGEGETLLVEATELTIPGVGRLHLQPGGGDVAELLREQQRLNAQRDNLLQQLGIESLTQGEDRARQAHDLTNTLAQNRARLEALAPEGLDELASQCGLNDQRAAELAGKLEQLPPAQPDLPPLADAEATERKAGAALKSAEQQDTRSRTDLELAQGRLETARQEWQRLHEALDDPQRQQRERDANNQLVDLKAEQARLNSEIEQRQQQIDAADPQTLAQDVERFTRSAEAMEKQASQREQEISELQVRLDEQGGLGLEEKHAESQQQFERRTRRRDQLAHRAAALDLLLDRLRERRQGLTQQLQAPLQKHLNHYLKLLFPDARLAVDEHLVPEALTRPHHQNQGQGRGEEQGSLDALSFGSREQLGLISRLAYADLLREAEQPTLIILDDALVHSDSGRREQMKRILFDAGQRHQILLLSCHPENWRDLGATERDMQALKVSAP